MPFTINDDFNCTGETLTVSEDVSFTGGTSVLTNSTWNITGNLAAQTGVTFASDSFNGSDWTVSGTFNFAGVNGGLLNLAASTAWTLNVSGAGTASYVDVANSNASGGSIIYATDSEDDGNNLNWVFYHSTIQEAIRSLLLADVRLDDYKIYPNVVRQGRPLPFIDYNLVSSTTEHDLLGPISITEDLLNYHVFTTNYGQSVTVGNYIEDILDHYSGLVDGLQILNITILDSLDMPEAPEDGSDKWLYHRVIRIKTYSK